MSAPNADRSYGPLYGTVNPNALKIHHCLAPEHQCLDWGGGSNTAVTAALQSLKLNAVGVGKIVEM